MGRMDEREGLNEMDPKNVRVAVRHWAWWTSLFVYFCVRLTFFSRLDAMASLWNVKCWIWSLSIRIEEQRRVYCREAGDMVDDPCGLAEFPTRTTAFCRLLECSDFRIIIGEEWFFHFHGFEPRLSLFSRAILDVTLLQILFTRLSQFVTDVAQCFSLSPKKP